MGSTPKALIPVASVVLAAHAAVLWGLPAMEIQPKAPIEVAVMETRTVAIAPPPAPTPPPPAPAPSSEPAPAPAPKPKPKPAPRPKPAPAAPAAQDTAVTDSDQNQAQANDTQGDAATDSEANAPHTAAPADAPPAPPQPPAPPAPSVPPPAPQDPPEPEASDNDTAKAMQVTPAGGAPLPPGTVLPVSLPGAATLHFNASGQVKGFQYSAGAELQWQHDGQYYKARQSISMFLMGERAQISEGLITPHGLQPLNFTDQGRKSQSASFDVASGKARFSDGTAEAAISDGVQDRLSVFLQLSALIAAAPEKYPQGTVIDLTTSSARAATRWRFKVGPSETLALPAGSVTALRLDKLPGRNKTDQQGAIWLAPAMQYLPVRIRLTQGQDDFVDLQLKKYEPAPQ